VKGNHKEVPEAERCVRSLLIDNYDSYTYNLYQSLSLVNGCEAVVVPNDVSWEALNVLDFDNIVVSPGPGRPEKPEDFGICKEVLARAEVPVLGVCLGHQGIVLAYGGNIAVGARILHGQRSRISHDAGPLFAGVPQAFWAVRYHSLLAVPPVPAGLRVIAWAEDGSIMGVAADDKPLYGVQFHPESCMTEHGMRILENFRDITFERMAGIDARRTFTSIPAEPVPQVRPARASLRILFERVPGIVDAEALFTALRGTEYIAWLDSARRGVGTGRYSYIASAGGALGEIVRYDQSTRTCTVTRAGKTRILGDTSIFEYLADDARRYDLVYPEAFPGGMPFDFCGGYVGWIGYECKADCGFVGVRTVATDDAALVFADRLVIVDHDCEDVSFLALVGADGQTEARAWLDAMRVLAARVRVEQPLPLQRAHGGGKAFARPLRSKEQYMRDIVQCQEVLRRGDSYQICLSNRFTIESEGSPFEAYRRLRRGNPAPYAAYLDFGQTQVACTSPESFLRVTRDGIVEAKPIKGTAPRYANPVRDAESALGLARDVKETAENLMIVDLLRNDLGRVCVVGSVHVPSLMAIESFETVHQMVSTVRGALRASVTAIDCLRACFPAGSMTGAPKLRSTQVIDALESAGRGIYSGVLGYVGVDGAAEFNVVIRTLVHHRGYGSVGAGGGITVLSDGEREWNEVVLKVRSVLNALEANIEEQ
jgi:para-aminobenzoate synthetase